MFENQLSLRVFRYIVYVVVEIEFFTVPEHLVIAVHEPGDCPDFRITDPADHFPDFTLEEIPENPDQYGKDKQHDRPADRTVM